MSESHSLMDGKLHVYRRENSRFWQCATYLSGRNYRQSTKETNIAYAREFARDWYLDRVAEDRLRRHGKPRTAYSLRHTYISMRLMEGADIYQVAKNCRTSVEMIEKYYASHIKNVLDASAINVRKAKPAKGRAGTAQAAKVD